MHASSLCLQGAESLERAAVEACCHDALQVRIKHRHVPRMLPVGFSRVGAHALAPIWWLMTEEHTVSTRQFVVQAPSNSFRGEASRAELLIELLESAFHPSASLAHSHKESA